MTDLDGPRAQPQSGGPAKQLVVLLHGLGADGNDLIQLTPYLGQALPDAAFVSPHAPEACDMAPFGKQWFSLQDQSPQAIDAGARRAAPTLDAFLDAELRAHGLTADKLALVGFSQGGMMALHVGLRRADPVACICAFSSLLPGGDHLADEIQSRPPVLLVHGEADEIIPVQALGATEAALTANRVPVTSERRPGMGHGIDERGIQLAIETLRANLPGAAAR
ncbi:phospholipase/carboxylesterase [Limimonas halophila]|uniref:Phospholipase/carboxylesterase n=1 Tax=Limimonas halophila TaxID=1082479 RepID=A0A1G7ST38_9PROT|nr:dienelactone hydrolase family protein [Limimonas halophila]SDG26296.1 phospholipase/carboxylesterase [Limimonas halophila]